MCGERRGRRVWSNHWEPTTGSAHGDAGDCSPRTTSRDSRVWERTWGVSRGNNPQRGVSGQWCNPTAGPQFSDAGCRACGPAQTARRPIPGPPLLHYSPESTQPIRGIISLLGHRHPTPGSRARASRARSPGTGVAYCRVLRFLSPRPCARSVNRTAPHSRALAGRRFLARASVARASSTGRGVGAVPPTAFVGQEFLHTFKLPQYALPLRRQADGRFPTAIRSSRDTMREDRTTGRAFCGTVFCCLSGPLGTARTTRVCQLPFHIPGGLARSPHHPLARRWYEGVPAKRASETARSLRTARASLPRSGPKNHRLFCTPEGVSRLPSVVGRDCYVSE